MKCFNEAIIQSYIDNECSQREAQSVRVHLQRCANCSTKFEEQRQRAHNIRQLVNATVLQQSDALPLPPFVKPKKPKRKLRFGITLLGAAASVVAILFSTNHFNKKHKQLDYLFYQAVEFEIDANKPISEQELTMQLIDLNGNSVCLDESQF